MDEVVVNKIRRIRKLFQGAPNRNQTGGISVSFAVGERGQIIKSPHYHKSGSKSFVLTIYEEFVIFVDEQWSVDARRHSQLQSSFTHMLRACAAEKPKALGSRIGTPTKLPGVPLFFS